MSEYRQVKGELKLLERKNEFLCDVELWMLSAAPNRNYWQYPVNESVARLFLGKPLLTAYVGNGTILGDGHNFLEVYDPETGEIRGDFTGAEAERIVGSLSEDPADIRVVERDGDTWIVGKGTLWEWYCGQLCEQIRGLAEQGRTMPVSIETLVSQSHMNGDIEVMDEFIVLGVTILGLHVAPAVAGARITALQALDGEYQQLKLKAASYMAQDDTKPEPKNNETNPVGAEAEPPETTSKGVKQALIFNKKQLAALAQRFPDYTLLAASKDDESGEITVKMRNASFDVYSYKMASEAETIAPERICAVCANMNLGDEIFIDATDYADQLSAELRRMSADKANAEAQLQEARDALKKMQETERKRRIEASKVAVKKALDSFNENRTVKVSEDAVADVMKKAADGEYAECEDGEGCWVGDAAAERDCLAKCALSDIAELKKVAQQSRSVHVWDKLADNSAGTDDGSVGALLKRLKLKD